MITNPNNLCDTTLVYAWNGRSCTFVRKPANKVVCSECDESFDPDTWVWDNIQGRSDCAPFLVCDCGQQFFQENPDDQELITLQVRRIDNKQRRNEMSSYTKEQLTEIVELHRKWDDCISGGQRADLQGAHLQGAHLQGAHLQGAYLQSAYLQGAKINWRSHALISEILLLWAGSDVDKRKIAGLIGISTDWCWGQFLTIFNDPLFGSVIAELSKWVTEGDNAPSILIERAKLNLEPTEKPARRIGITKKE